jgi:hypothetical protein
LEIAPLGICALRETDFDARAIGGNFQHPISRRHLDSYDPCLRCILTNRDQPICQDAFCPETCRCLSMDWTASTITAVFHKADKSGSLLRICLSWPYFRRLTSSRYVVEPLSGSLKIRWGSGAGLPICLLPFRPPMIVCFPLALFARIWKPFFLPLAVDHHCSDVPLRSAP